MTELMNRISAIFHRCYESIFPGYWMFMALRCRMNMSPPHIGRSAQGETRVAEPRISDLHAWASLQMVTSNDHTCCMLTLSSLRSLFLRK